jgi:hypothetical protein
MINDNACKDLMLDLTITKHNYGIQCITNYRAVFVICQISVLSAQTK